MGIRRYNFIFPQLVGERTSDPGQPQNILGRFFVDVEGRLGLKPESIG